MASLTQLTLHMGRSCIHKQVFEDMFLWWGEQLYRESMNCKLYGHPQNVNCGGRDREFFSVQPDKSSS